MSDDFLTRYGYRQVVRISGKALVRIFGTRSAYLMPLRVCKLQRPTSLGLVIGRGVEKM